MKKRINLFSKTRQKTISAAILKKIITYTTASGIILFIGLVVFTLLQLQVRQEFRQLTEEKKVLLETLNRSAPVESKTVFFINKKGQLNNYLKDDSQFLPYYNLLNTVLTESSSSSTIESLAIDKTKATKFTVFVTNFDNIYQFLRYIESPTFLSNFEELTLSNLSLVQDDAASQGYHLDFEGKFKNLDGTVTN